MAGMLKKYDETDMMQALGEQLLPGETITAAVYCVFKATKFWESVTAPSGNVIPGYAAVTDRNRFIGVKYQLLHSDAVSVDLNHLKTIKIKNMMLSQKMITLEEMSDRKVTVKFQLSTKIVGANFPNQAQYAEMLLDALNARQNTL